jgi:hypothetical protein
MGCVLKLKHPGETARGGRGEHQECIPLETCCSLSEVKNRSLLECFSKKRFPRSALDWDKFALSFYDKRTLDGVRVRLDLEKTRSYPHIYNGYMRLVSKKSIDHDVLLDNIIAAGRSMLSRTPVHITQFYGKKENGEIAICSGCGEAYPTLQGEQCLACQGNGYYEY